MALTFTDQQIKDISKESLTIPISIAALQQTLIDLQILIDDLAAQDGANKVFSDNFINIITQYHTELENLDGTTKTSYSEAILDAGARLTQGNEHFPVTPTAWVNFQPKLADSNNGDPTSAAPDHEELKVADVQAAVALLKNGFTDGALTDDLATAYVAGVFEVTTGGFSANQRVLIIASGVAVFGEIDSVAAGGTGAQEITLKTPITIEVGTPSVADQITNFHGGFNNTERTNETPSVGDEQDYFDALTAAIESGTDDWEVFLGNEKTALQANDATGSEATEITAAIALIDSVLAIIATWEGEATKYSDTALGPFETKLGARGAEITARVVEITTARGIATQVAAGDFSGSGNYLLLFNWVNIRINKVEGTLSRFYNSGLAKKAIESSIATKEDKRDEYDLLFLVKTLSEDVDGSEFIQMNDVTGLSNSDAIKLMDDDEPVVDRTIVDIQGTTLELNLAVADYTTSKLARVVKQL